jgi:carbon-monoxide dehydrogenase small subunit
MSWGESRTITLTVNGTTYTREVEVRFHLADVLRHELGLTGTHLGCEHGVCGACTVLVNGRSARSCLMLAVQADGAEITTIEGIADIDGPHAGGLHPLQEAFREFHGLQCGFCTPGMLTTLIELLRDNPAPTEEEVRIAISGNLCRCTGYQGIVDAALATAKNLREATAPA